MSEKAKTILTDASIGILILSFFVTMVMVAMMAGCPSATSNVPPVSTVDMAVCPVPAHLTNKDACGSFTMQARPCVKCQGQGGCIDPQAKVYCVRSNVNGQPDCNDPACVTP